jgi:hypothetical protein
MFFPVHSIVRRLLSLGNLMVLLAGVGAVGFGGERIVAHKAAAKSPPPPPPRCVPAALNGSAQLPGTPVSISPQPGSYDASARTQISLLGAPISALVHVRASGSRSGAHPGRLLAYSQGDGASFVPSKPFQTGETVTVRGSVIVAGRGKPFSVNFTVAQPDAIGHAAAEAEPASAPGEVQRYRSRPDLQPPAVAVTTQAAAGAAPGYIMTTPYSGPGQDGPMIFDSSGQLVWFDPLPHGSEATNLQVQQPGGAPVLTWWQGYIPPQGFGQGVEVIADSSYHQSIVRAGNGYQADLHDFQLTPQGTALMTVFNPIRCDLSHLGGPRESAITDGVMQEVDLRTHLVRREWHSLDHVAVSESYSSDARSSTTWPFDYFHINSLDLHADGTILISARNTSALYVLNGATGQVTMRIGGRHPTVKMGSGAATAYQHDAKQLPNGEISIFDNGGVPKVHAQSRGILVSVNSQAGTDTLVTQFTHSKPISAGSQGNIQSLEGGNFLIGWGPVPWFSEYTSSGQLVFEAHMPRADQSYRAYRFPWSGDGIGAPAIAVAAAAGGSAGAAGALDVYASWNGATNVVSWRVLAGASAGALTPVASAPRGGFETAIPTPGAEAYVAVQALDADGNVLGTSPTIKG